MKKTLDGMLKSEFKPKDLVVHKSDGPLRKLKVLSEHWIAKARESNDKCSTPSRAEDSSFDPASNPSPRARMSSPRRASNVRRPLVLHHNYSNILSLESRSQPVIHRVIEQPPPQNNIRVAPVRQRPKMFKYDNENQASR